jgi:hypothetical protein
MIGNCSGKTATSIHEWRFYSRTLARRRPALAIDFAQDAPTPTWGGSQPGMFGIVVAG